MNSKSDLELQQIAGRTLKELVPICGVCHMSLSGHLFKSLAQTPIRKNDHLRTQALLDAVKRCDLNEVQQFQEFDGLLDNIVVYALKCGDGKCSMVAYISRFELWDVDSFLLQQLVSQHDSPLVEGDWNVI